MESLQDLFVHEPFNILVVAGIFLVAHLVFKQVSPSYEAPLIVPAICWAAYAGWEYAMMKWNPEALNRVDLLLIWPILLLLTIFFTIQAFR